MKDFEEMSNQCPWKIIVDDHDTGESETTCQISNMYGDDECCSYNCGIYHFAEQLMEVE